LSNALLVLASLQLTSSTSFLMIGLYNLWWYLRQ